jgi:hypothetical protein
MESYLCLHGYERLSHAVACSSTRAGAQRVLQLEVLPISCLHQKKNELSLCHHHRKIYSGMLPASPPGLGFSGSSSSKYCQYLAYIRRKINYPYATHHRIVYLTVFRLPRHQDWGSLWHPPQKNLLAVCCLPRHQDWGSADPPARSIADILPISEEK